METFYYEIVVDTDCYAGAFERAMAAYIFGAVGESGVDVEYVPAPNSFPISWAHNDNGGALVAFDHESRGWEYHNYGNIAPTPGLRNTGDGTVVPYNGETVNGPVWPAYQSVVFRFENGFTPSTAQVEEVKDRALDFPSVYKNMSAQNEDVTITAIRVVKTQSTTTQSVYSLNIP